MRVKPGSARIEQRGNLITIVYETYTPKWEDDKGQEVLPPPCVWRIPVTFFIRELEPIQYYVIVGRKSDKTFRVVTSLVIDEPPE